MIEGVHIWRAALDGEACAGPEQLSGPEQERFESFLGDQPRYRWLAARWALRRVLAGYLEQPPAAVEIAVDTSGKPRLPGDELHFNLSHSGDLALVAVSSSRPVGVDVERVEAARDLLSLAERALEEEEVEKVRAAPPAYRPIVFYAAWVRHEARLKCLGVGLAGPVPPTPVAVQAVDVGPWYAAAVAVADEEIGPVRCHTLQG